MFETQRRPSVMHAPGLARGVCLSAAREVGVAVDVAGQAGAELGGF